MILVEFCVLYLVAGKRNMLDMIPCTVNDAKSIRYAVENLTDTRLDHDKDVG